MSSYRSVRQVQGGISAAKRGNTPVGYALLGEAVKESNSAEVKAWYGYCLASEMKDFNRGHQLCMEALKQSPANSDIYLALARLYLLAGRRQQAISTLEKGLEQEQNGDIRKLFECIGMRKAPVFRFLHRDNPVNVTSGRLFARIGLR